MAGRWAQLTVDAHIAHALDYKKPVKPFVEDVVLDVMERHRMLTVYNVLNNADIDKLADLRESLLDLLIGWESSEDTKQQPAMNPQDKIAFLQKLKDGRSV